jgi:hypothetical protein
MTLVDGAMTVLTNSLGVPERFVWHGTRYKVTDTPTPLDFNVDAVTHLPFTPTGWRFQGTDEERKSLIFDVVSLDQGQEWRVVHTYR